MGYRDAKLKLCENQTVTEEASDIYLDTEFVNPPWEKGWPLEAAVIVRTAGTGTTGFVVHLVHSASGAPVLDGDNLASVTVPKAELAAGKEIKLRFPEGVELKRYIGLHFANITGDESMVVDAYIQPVTA